MFNGMKYLRVSLLSACNLNCTYCRPAGSESGHPLALTAPGTFENAIACLHDLGIRKVRFTGGEPTLYPWLSELVSFTKSLSPSVHTAMTTNGRRLPALARDLADAGLDSVNISLDTLQPRRFHEITGRDYFEDVLAGIDAARTHITSVKLNMVIMDGVNADEAAEMVRFANGRNIDIRFIEFMPTRNSESQPALYLSGETLRSRLPFPLRPATNTDSGAARYYVSDELSIRVGFIEAVSQPFCDTCDRIRLTADGNLFGCLFSGLSFNLFDEMSGDRRAIRNRIEELIRARTNLGCSSIVSREQYLPEFVVTGG